MLQVCVAVCFRWVGRGVRRVVRRRGRRAIVNPASACPRPRASAQIFTATRKRTQYSRVTNPRFVSIPRKERGIFVTFSMNITLFRPRRLGPKRRGGNSEGINSVTSPTRPSSTAATRRETKTPPTTLRLWNTPTHLLYSRERRRLLRTLPQHFPQRLIHPRAPARRQLHRLVERVHLPLARDDDLRRLPSG